MSIPARFGSTRIVLVALLLVPFAPSAPARAAGTIFLARCAPSGCTYAPGVDDSTTNHSSLLNGQVQLAAFPHGDAAWSELVACVARAYAPFDVTVTDVDPGASAHWEIAIAGTPGNVGLPSGVLGVAPFTCNVVANGVAFAFAGATQNSAQLCWTSVQQSGSLFGLDHEYLAADAMTYLGDSLEKRFTSTDAPCGEFSPRACTCGGNTQSSASLLRSILGPAGPGAELFTDGFTAFTSSELAPVEYGSTSRWDAQVPAAP